MGTPKTDKGRIVTQTVFDLIAYAAPQDVKVAAAIPGAALATAPK
jgi:type IV pilus assembly protein PilO